MYFENNPCGILLSIVKSFKSAVFHEGDGVVMVRLYHTKDISGNFVI